MNIKKEQLLRILLAVVTFLVFYLSTAYVTEWKFAFGVMAFTTPFFAAWISDTLRIPAKKVMSFLVDLTVVAYALGWGFCNWNAWGLVIILAVEALSYSIFRFSPRHMDDTLK